MQLTTGRRGTGSLPVRRILNRESAGERYRGGEYGGVGPLLCGYVGGAEAIEGPGRMAAMCREALGDGPGFRRPLAVDSFLEIVEITCCDDRRSFRPPV